jgi:N-methylhydantoinase B/oxoprolinase/acetone carboxylase alpha subunit
MVVEFAGIGGRGQWIVVEPTAGGWGAWQGSDGDYGVVINAASLTVDGAATERLRRSS